jgi:hypothetical protein
VAELKVVGIGKKKRARIKKRQRGIANQIAARRKQLQGMGVAMDELAEPPKVESDRSGTRVIKQVDWREGLIRSLCATTATYKRKVTEIPFTDCIRLTDVERQELRQAAAGLLEVIKSILEL